jgi:hypothetical protein
MCKQQCIWLYNFGDEIGEEMAEDFLAARVRLLQGLSRHCRSTADVAKALWKQQQSAKKNNKQQGEEDSVLHQGELGSRQQSAIKNNKKQGEEDSVLHQGELGSQILSLRILIDDDEEGHEQMTVAGIEQQECEHSDIVGRNRKTAMPGAHSHARPFSTEVESSAEAVIGSSAEAVVRLAQLRDANRRGTGGSGVGNARRGSGGRETGGGGGGGGVHTADEYGDASPFSDNFTDSGEEDDEVFSMHDVHGYALILVLT